MLLSNFSSKILKAYKTALNTKNPPYYTPFNFINQLASFLCEVINHKVEFCIQFLTKNNNVHVYMHALSANWCKEINQTVTFQPHFACK